MRCHSGALGALAEGGGCSASCARSSPAAAAGGRDGEGLQERSLVGGATCSTTVFQPCLALFGARPCWDTHADARLGSLHSSI